MKIINLFAAISIILFVTIHTTAQTTYVPDNNFELALINLGFDSGIPDDYVPTANIISLPSLNINGKNISDLTGIEAFAALTELNCGNNKLSSLNLNGNPALQELMCFNNQITSLDVDSNPNLSELVCYNNQLTNLNVSANPVLLKLNCSNNRITSLDLSSNTSLNYINCSNNDLTSLNLKNANNANMTGGNYYDTGVDSRNNPELFCIQVDNVENSISYSTWYEDFWAEYNLNCTGFTLEKAYIPDDNFEQALINLGYDYGTPDDYVPVTSIKKVTSLNINNKNISDLTGIESFTALKALYCNSNKLIACNFSSNVNLVYIDCSGNQISQLNVSGNSQLQTLYCQNNMLVDLNIGSNSELAKIYCNNNKLSGLDLRNANSNLRINTTNNPNLFCIEVNDVVAANNNYNWIKSAYTAYSENCSLYIPEMTYVPDDNFEQALINLGCDTGSLNDSVPTVAIKSIKNLSISYGTIQDLTGIEDFTALEELNCNNNKISDIDLSSNVNLKILNCSNNQLTHLDLASNTILTELQCNNNKISDLDVSSNSLLTTLYSYDNLLTGLNLRNGNNSNMGINVQNNPDLLCIQVDDPDASYLKSNWIKNAYTAYAENCSNHVVEMIYVPDDNFEQALIDLEIDYGPLNDSVPKIAVAYLKSLKVNYKNIIDLTGIEGFENLEQLYCYGNEISELNLKSNTKLNVLKCQSNKIYSLDLSANVSLTQLDCSNDSLIDLDLSSNHSLTYLNAYNNQLTGLNLQNGNNINMRIDIRYNDDLLCVQVDDSIAAETYSNWEKDHFTVYTLNCSNYIPSYTLIPDDNFEEYLINNRYDSGIPDDSVITSVVKKIETISFNSRGISDLSGIEDFKSLWFLDCSGNLISSIDLSGNINLKYLDCQGCSIDSIDLSKNTNLETLLCSNNMLTSLDLSLNHSLHFLNCENNYLNNLDLASNMLLTYVDCSHNVLTNIDLRNENNQNLTYFRAWGNLPACILVDDTLAATSYSNWEKDTWSDYTLDCSNHKIEMIYVPDDNFEQFLIDIKYDYGEPNDSVPIAKIKLCTSLSIQDMNIKDLTGIEYFTEISNLDCSYNQIEQLDLSNNNLLRVLQCNNNKLRSINLYGNDTITFFNCSYNELTNLDIRTKTNLYQFNCSHNYLKELDVSEISNLTFLYCNNNLMEKFIVNEVRPIVIDTRNNPKLTCIEYFNPSQAESNTKWKRDEQTGYSEDCGYDFRKTYIPDDNFEQALIDLGYDSGELDDSVLTSQIIEINNLDISNKNISNLQGIEAFENLYSINCSNNSITQLNLNSNKQLTSVICRYNQLSTLSVDSLAYLELLDCANNQLTSIKTGNNTILSIFDCSNNKISSLNLTSNVELANLICNANLLTELDLHLNPRLTELHCGDNKLLSLDLSMNNELTTLYCYRNNLSDLNIKNGSNWHMTGNGHEMTAYENPNLTCIQVDNAADAASYTDWNKDSGARYSEDCSVMPAMTFIPDDNFEQALIDLGYDSGALNDSVPTNIINSIQILLLQDRHISELTGIEDFRSLTFLDCSGNNITYLELHNNVELDSVNCSANQLTNLYISANTKLMSLNCEFNQLTSLEVNNNVELVQLSCSNNKLDSLNLESLKYLSILSCFNNKITTLRLNGCSNLTVLNCSQNQITALDLQNNPNLQFLDCTSNSLYELDLSYNTNLYILQADWNKLRFVNLKNGNNANMTKVLLRGNSDLSCIQVDKANVLNESKGWYKDEWSVYSEDCSQAVEMIYIPDDNFEQALIDLGYDTGEPDDSIPAKSINGITELNVSNKNISDLTGIEDFENLTYLICSLNQLTELNLNKNKKLNYLECGNNKLDSLNLDSLNLTHLSCSYNSLSFLKFDNSTSLNYLNCAVNSIDSVNTFNCTFLEELNCSINKLTKIDLSYNHSLTKVFLYDNELTMLNLQNGNNYNISNIDVSNNHDLSCIQVDDIVYSQNNNSWVKDEEAEYALNCGVNGVGVPVPEYNALVDFYNKFNGENWNNNQNWLDTMNHSVADWQGITVEMGNVTAIDLSGLNLEGDISGYFADFDSLKWLNLSNNNFSGELSALFGNGDLSKSLVSENTTLDYLNIANNHFTFADLEPDATRLNSIAEFIYAPQALIGMKKDTSVYRGENITLEFPDYIPGSGDYYTWLKNGAMSGNSNMLIYTVENAAYADSGFYTLSVTNVLFPELVLQSDTIILKVLIPVGNSENSLLDEIILYPNPANEKIFIDLKNRRTNLKIFNYAGILVYKEKACPTGWLDIKAFSPGIYIFRFENEFSGMINKKVVLE